MNAPSDRRVLYLSYDGMTDPLGGSQVLPYLTGLAALGHHIVLVSVEKPIASAAARAAVRAQCDAAGITWHPIVYHKRPPVLSTLYDLFQMRRQAEALQATHRFDWVHCRSYLTALVGLAMKRKHGLRLLFDMRGFWADERVEGGLWNLANPLFRAMFYFFKRRETDLLRAADHIVMLTEKGRQVLVDRTDEAAADKPISVIPCCVDFAAFDVPGDLDRKAARAAMGIAADARVVVYLGSIGTWYMLEEMLDCFAVELERHLDAILLFISRDDPQRIRAAALARDIPPAAIVVRAASRAEVAHYLAVSDYGLFFIRPTFSKIASCPTKLGELLAMGLPVVTNAGVGDVDAIVAQSGAGVFVERFDKAAYGKALDAINALPRRGQEWRQRARRWFDLDSGVAAYDAIYRAPGLAAAGVDRARR